MSEILAYWKVILILMGIAALIITWVNSNINRFIPLLIPLIIIKITGLLSIFQIIGHYFSSIIILFFSGMIISKLVEYHQLHNWFFIKFIKYFNKSKYLFLFGIIAISAILSSFISNTTAALLLFPFVLQTNSPTLLLGMCYGASLGGLTTILGSTTNIVFLKFWNQQNTPIIDYLKWIQLTAPLVVIGFLVLFIILSLFLFREKTIFDQIKVDAEFNFKRKHKLVIILFLSFIAGLLLKQYITFLPSEAIWGLIIASFIIFTPIKFSGQSFFPFKLLKEINYNIFILFGGTLALADALNRTNFTELLSPLMVHLVSLPAEQRFFIIILIMIFFTEISSNTTAAAIFIPLVAKLNAQLNLPLFSILFALTAASSLSFMLPTATPPNAIAFSSNKISMRRMIFIGFILNITFAWIITQWGLRLK